MKQEKLYIVMVGLPARGKTIIAENLKENLVKDGIKTKTFNNGDLRRKLSTHNTSYAEFYNPGNKEGSEFREKVAIINIRRAKDYLKKTGHIAILDATNVTSDRREMTRLMLADHPILFVECINEDEDILEASILGKIDQPEFREMEKGEAIEDFKKRISYYASIYEPLKKDAINFVKLDSLNNRIIEEDIAEDIPYYDRIRDFVVTDRVKNLYLIRHGETYFNLENRIGGDSDLTEHGREQANALAVYFQKKKIPLIFTSMKKRTVQTAEPIRELQEKCTIIPIEEFNEIDAGVCECMSYKEIREKMPQVYLQRKRHKYNYIYENGEGYVSMKKRVDKGIKKALYLSGDFKNIMIIGHRGVNRMILSNFLYRRKEDVPYVYIPQDKFYHIVATQDEKLFELKKYKFRAR